MAAAHGAEKHPADFNGRLSTCDPAKLKLRLALEQMPEVTPGTSPGMLEKIGRYQITRELGRGAMGVVYHAIDPVIGRPVAIKTLRLRDVDDADHRRRLRERLFREARSAGALSHPGIVTIYDMDEVDGLAYIAMEFVDGETLDEILSRPKLISKDRLTEVLRQAAAALDYAHRKGVIHRDVKPANIMIDVTGAVKITDFGIAKITQLEGQTLTGVLVGTPNYMSPEQVQGHDIDGRSDQFSLGVIAYEMLTGERPFVGEQISTVVYKIVSEQPAPVQNINTSLNEGVDRAIRKALHKKPDRRYSTCTAFTTGLDATLAAAGNWRVLARKAHQAMPTAAAGAVTRTFRPVPKAALTKPAGAASNPVPIVDKVPEKRQKKRRRTVGDWLILLAGGAVILCGILALLIWQTDILDVPWIHDLVEPGSSSNGDQASEEAPARTTPQTAPDRRSPMPAPTQATPSQQDNTPSQPVSTPPVQHSSKPDEPATNQTVKVLTDPAGATATLDGSSELSCRTPCKLPASSGVHTVMITLTGYQAESREVRVSHEDTEMPLVSMRAANGVLMLTSDPSGLSVIVDGRSTGYQTPVRMTLPAGPHNVTVDRSGTQASEAIQIRNGDLTALKLIVR
jgi:serine/threonine protein kinase